MTLGSVGVTLQQQQYHALLSLAAALSVANPPAMLQVSIGSVVVSNPDSLDLAAPDLRDSFV